jgi:hypothetical protein
MSVKIGFEVLNFKMKLRNHFCANVVFCMFSGFSSVVLMKYNSFGCK